MPTILELRNWDVQMCQAVRFAGIVKPDLSDSNSCSRGLVDPVSRVLSHFFARDRFFRAKRSHPLCCTDFPGQRIKLLGERHGSGAIDSKLDPANQEPEIDAGKHIAGRSG